MTIDKFLATLVNRWLVLLYSLTVGAGAYIGSRLMTPLYQSTALIQIALRSSINQGDYYASLLASEQLVLVEATLATSDPVLREVASHYANMTVKAALENRVTVYRGAQWRPYMHVRDAAQSILSALEPTLSSTAPEIYNYGFEIENYTLKELGQHIAQEVPGAELQVVPEKIDRRSYRIDFGRIKQALDFSCKYRIIDGIREICITCRHRLY